MLKRFLSSIAALSLLAGGIVAGGAPANAAQMPTYTGDCEVYDNFAACDGTDFGDLGSQDQVKELYFYAGETFDFRPLAELKNLSFVSVEMAPQAEINVRVGEEFSSAKSTAFDGSPIYFDFSQSDERILRVAEGRFKTSVPIYTYLIGKASGSYINDGQKVDWQMRVAGSTDLISATDLVWGSSVKTKMSRRDFDVSTQDATIPVGTALAVRGSLPLEKTEQLETECNWYRNGQKVDVVRVYAPGECTYSFAAEDSGKEIKLVAKHSPRFASSPHLLAGEDVRTFRYTVKEVFYYTVSVSGSPTVDSRLSAVTPKFAADTKLAYQWLRNGKAIKDAKKSTYRLTAADQGQKISVTVTASKPGYFTKKVTSAKTAAIKKGTFKVKKAPKITGKAVFGQTLKVDAGTRSAKPSKYTYQWLRDSKAIKGATKSSYKLVKTDLGKKISVKVTATRAGFTSQTSTTAKTKTVVKAAFKLKKSPTVTGKVKLGKKLKAKPGNWSPKPDKYSYQWYRSGAAIKKATKSTYKVTKRDRGAVLYVQVTAKKAGYKDKSAQSKVK